MYVSACRLEEALCMTVTHFSTECRTLFFRRKGDRSEQCKGHARAWHRERKGKDAGEGVENRGRSRSTKHRRFPKTYNKKENCKINNFEKFTLLGDTKGGFPGDLAGALRSMSRMRPYLKKRSSMSRVRISMGRFPTGRMCELVLVRVRMRESMSETPRHTRHITQNKWSRKRGSSRTRARARRTKRGRALRCKP